jgi:hypothetical protein
MEAFSAWSRHAPQGLVGGVFAFEANTVASGVKDGVEKRDLGTQFDFHWLPLSLYVVLKSSNLLFRSPMVKFSKPDSDFPNRIKI